MRVLIQVEYDGTNFCGWQKQNNSRSVQEELERILSGFFGADISLFASGRTDAGVHAEGQCAHFDAPTKNNFKIQNLPNAINPLLPKDVKIIKAKQVSKQFHARFDVKNKTYVYKSYVSKIESPIKNLYYHQIFADSIDVEKIKSASTLLLGEHNFEAFKSSNTNVKDFLRTIYKISVTYKNGILKIQVCGNGFLYNMVRIIAGTLIEIGINKRDMLCIDEAFKTKNRKCLGETAPAKGLYLKKVVYKHY